MRFAKETKETMIIWEEKKKKKNKYQTLCLVEQLKKKMCKSLGRK